MINEINKVHDLINKIDKKNKKILKETNPLTYKDLVEYCKKYPKAIIVSEQPFEKLKDSHFVAEFLSYPDLHFTFCSPVKKNYG